MLKRSLAVSAALASVLPLAACGSDDSASDTGDILFAASLPLTGSFSVPGKFHQQGYELCVDTINANGGLLDGRQVKLEVSDNQSDPETVALQTDRFISVDDADILLGTFSTLLSFPASAVAERAQMVYPEPSDSSLQSHSRGLKYSFGFTLKPINYIGQTPVDAMSHFRDAGVIPEADFPKTAAVIYLDDFFTNSISLGLAGGTLEIPGTGETVDFGEGYLNEVGMDLVFEEKFPADYSDWIGLANRVKNSGAEMLFVLTLPPAEVDIVKAMSTVNYQPKATWFTQGTYPEFGEQLGDAANGIMTWSTWDPEIDWTGAELAGEPMGNAEFVAAIEQELGGPANEDQAQAFTVCQTMAEAIEAVGSTDNTEIRDWMASRSEDDPVQTIQGPYYWDDKGLTAGRDVVLLQWQDGKLRFVYPQGEEYPNVTDVLWPKRNW